MPDASTPDNEEFSIDRDTVIFWVFVALMALLVLPHVQVQFDLAMGYIQEDQVPDQITEHRRIIIQVLGGLAVIAGLYLTYRRIVATERRADAAMDQVASLQEGQITERFAQAVEHLASDELQIRLGGIYAMERIAKDSEDDYPTVLEVLCAFVRETSPARRSDELDDRSEESLKAPPATDVQAVLTVLGRIQKHAPDDSKPVMDLSGIDASKADLRNTNFAGANFSMSNLVNVNLERANLGDVALNGANLDDAKLRFVNLSRASLRWASLNGANLWSANLNDAVLYHANLRGANLWGATLIDALLEVTNLEKTHLGAARLDGAILDDADLSGAKLKGLIENTEVSADQLCEAISLYGAELPDNLAAEVQAQCPELLEADEE